ncbi:hypothetical protein [Serratia ficaria]|uniref:hypothetical protein n=1 Tax=Serratia ficaria TaxID=61651 RepID=UPI0021B74A6F|nr:hypothetical protein [Serratia ficaria]
MAAIYGRQMDVHEVAGYLQVASEIAGKWHHGAKDFFSWGDCRTFGQQLTILHQYMVRYFWC